MGRNMRIACFMALLLGFVSCKESAPKRNDWMLFKKYHKRKANYYLDVQNGFKAYAKKNRDGAYLNLMSAVKKGCVDGLVYYKLAIVSRASGKLKKATLHFEKAITAFKTAYKKHPYVGNVWLNLGNIRYIQKKYKEALAYYEKAYKIVGGASDIYFSLGMVYKRLKKYTQAAAFLEKADRNDFRVLFFLSGVYRQLKKDEAALSLMERAVSIRPESIRALDALGNFYYIKAEKFEKRSMYRDALKFYRFAGRCYIRAVRVGDDRYKLQIKNVIKFQLKNVLSKMREMRMKLK